MNLQLVQGVTLAWQLVEVLADRCDPELRKIWVLKSVWWTGAQELALDPEKIAVFELGTGLSMQDVGDSWL